MCVHMYVCAYVCVCVYRAEVDLLSELLREEVLKVRKLMCALILATDMSKHFDHISKSRLRRLSPDFDYFNDESDRE